MTVGELINVLKTFDPNEKIYCFPDNRDGTDSYIDSSEVFGVHKVWNELENCTDILIV